MSTRYDYMCESCIRDIDNEAFPDPLTVNYADINFTKIPGKGTITQGDLVKPYNYYYRTYCTTNDDGLIEGDDIFFNINAVPYIGTLHPGDIMVNIYPEDLESFNTNKNSNSDTYGEY